MKLLIIAVVAAGLIGVAPHVRAETVSFEGKQVKLIIPSTAGGGTDVAARLLGRFFNKYLPGNPTVVPQNMPGGGGVTSLNFLAQQAKPDGLTIAVSSSTQADPITYRTPQARYNPAKLAIVGGFSTGDDYLVVRAEALPRLFDSSKPPVIMGTNAGAPRRGMRMSMWGDRFLGWNMKWVTGYPGSNDLLLALERGEIEMSTFGRDYLADKLMDTSKYKILFTEGVSKNDRTIGRTEIDNAPKFVDAMQGKVDDPKMRAAFDYWRAGFMFKWVTLPPDTPQHILNAYREAFVKLSKDEEFIQLGDQVMPGFSVVPPEDMAKAIINLEKTPDEALKTTEEFQKTMN
jgi:tripartite-type tricarboxylate transporter receptor subunit TctC